MKIKTAFTVMVCILFLGTSCTEEAADKATLALSETALQFTKETGEKTIEVTTNQEQWVTIPNMDWIDCTRAGNSLTIKVTRNETNRQRSGKIAVVAGDAVQMIEIRQNETEMEATDLPEKLVVDQWGGEYVYYIQSGGKDWSIQTDAQWLSVTSLPFSNKVVIRIPENSQIEEREATLLLSAGTLTKKYTVFQAGAMHLILPLLDFGASVIQIDDFEKARKSDFVGSRNIFPFVYLTKSAAFPQVDYNFGKDFEYVNSTIHASSREVVADGKLNTMLEEKGFVLKNSYDKFCRYFELKNEAHVVEVNVVDGKFGVSKNKSGIFFRNTPRQKESHKTFDSFPELYPNMHEQVADIEKIKKWEVANGGTFNEEKSYEYVLYFDVNDPLIKERYYKIQEWDNKLNHIGIHTRDNTSHVFEHEESFWFTEEFKNLMQKEGFSYYFFGATAANSSGTDSYDVFYNETKECFILFSSANFNYTGVIPLIVVARNYKSK